MDSESSDQKGSDRHISRRQLFGIGAGFTAGVFLAPFMGIPDVAPQNETPSTPELFDQLTEMENSNNAQWSFYQRKVSGVLEKTITNPHPETLESVRIIVQNTKGESVALVRTPDSGSLTGRVFTPEDGWRDGDISENEIQSIVEDASFMSISFESQPFEVDSTDPAIIQLQDEAGVSTDYLQIQKHHELRLTYNQIDTEINREIQNNYFIVGDSQRIGLNLFEQNRPAGFDSEPLDPPFVRGFGPNNNNTVPISEETITNAVQILENTFHSFIQNQN